jgi:hypothetical protein
MKSWTGIRAILVGASLCVLGAAPPNASSRGGPYAEPGYRQYVDISTTRPATPGCTYRSRIHGTIVSLDTVATMPGLGGVYLPDGLTVDAALDCGPALPPRQVSQTVTLPAPVSREQLGSAIERAGQMQVPEGRLVCTVIPRLDVRNGVPVTTDVRSRCEPGHERSGI